MRRAMTERLGERKRKNRWISWRRVGQIWEAGSVQTLADWELPPVSPIDTMLQKRNSNKIERNLAK